MTLKRVYAYSSSFFYTKLSNDNLTDGDNNITTYP